MNDLISRQAAIDALTVEYMAVGIAGDEKWAVSQCIDAIKQLPSAQERKKDIIQKFHNYQIEWLKSHYDIELEPQLEEMIVRFLHDTANCYMMGVEHETD